MPSAKPQSDLHAHDDAATANGAAPLRRLRLTPAWAGRDVSLEEFETAKLKEGWRYELIDGRIEVLPNPDPPHDVVLEWINDRLRAYRDAHRATINYVTSGSRVFIPVRGEATCPQPDLAAYRDFPTRWPRQLQRWQDAQPVLVIEIISERYHKKDLVRNVALYKEAPSVKEYWVLDPRDGGHPTLLVYRKRGDRSWQKAIEVPFAGTRTRRLFCPASL